MCLCVCVCVQVETCFEMCLSPTMCVAGILICLGFRVTWVVFETFPISWSSHADPFLWEYDWFYNLIRTCWIFEKISGSFHPTREIRYTWSFSVYFFPFLHMKDYNMNPTEEKDEEKEITVIRGRRRFGWLVVYVLWYISLCRLFNVKPIFIEKISSISYNSV